ncbi:nuclear transport factor 2 family protein [Rufibacter psychrotolerans]|uniref:nuclear transport factor 2 family protein n=1 Tax=Rufibacter psychrotolerans TaxID=2812556 RepID=UPI0019689451|nr:nuclear transport factor 2 family protein [Rufibacter sp. SYSU D00308]
MKKMLLAAVAVLHLTTSSAQENPQLRQEIEKLDLAHAAAIFKGDAPALDALMDDNITVHHPTNRIVNEKQELLQLINAGVIRYTSFKRTPQKFLFFDQTVVVMGTEEVVPAPGAPNAGKTLTRRYTNIWMKKADTWKLTVRHANNQCEN